MEFASWKSCFIDLQHYIRLISTPLIDLYRHVASTPPSFAVQILKKNKKQEVGLYIYIQASSLKLCGRKKKVGLFLFKARPQHLHDPTTFGKNHEAEDNIPKMNLRVVLP